MAADANPDLEDRLARLAARRAAAPRTAAPAPKVGRGLGRGRKHRRHPAAIGRILAAGLSSSAFFSVIAALGAQSPASGAVIAAAPPPVSSFGSPSATARLPAPRPKNKVVVKVAHHKVYVDPQGRRVSPPAGSEPAVRPAAASGAGMGVVAPTPSPGPTYVVPAVRTTPAGGGSSRIAPPPTVAPPPTSARGATPQPTSPLPTPTTPTTVYVAPAPPPPPPPPACTGSKCP